MKPSVDRLSSYTAASTFPVKVLQHPGVLDAKGRIRPVHLQINPTNRCNLNCKFCSCAERNKHVSMLWEDMGRMLCSFEGMGTRALTVTGGGEPLLYPEIDRLLQTAEDLFIKVGLVTNGTVFDRMTPRDLTWVRVSVSDGRVLDDKFFDGLAAMVARMPETAWAFSYVLTCTPNATNLRNVLRFAAEHDFSHVRLVSDLLDLANVPDMTSVRPTIADWPGEHLVIYQGRKQPTRGRARCLISLLKPLVSAEGGIYPCCGVQYARDVASLDYDGTMRMGQWEDMERIYSGQYHFDGSVCSRCYYDNYNSLLDMMTRPIDHEDFV